MSMSDKRTGESGIDAPQETSNLMIDFPERHIKMVVLECRQCGRFEFRMFGTEPVRCHGLTMEYSMTLPVNGRVIPDHDPNVELET